MVTIESFSPKKLQRRKTDLWLIQSTKNEKQNSSFLLKFATYYDKILIYNKILFMTKMHLIITIVSEITGIA